MPRLSVLMPAPYDAATIHRAVRSVLHDLPRDGELVVSDDGSAHRALHAIDDQRLRLLPSHERGVSRALSALLSASDSEFVAFTRPDTLVLPGRFRRQLRALHDADVVLTATLTHESGAALRPSAPTAISPRAFPFHLLLSAPALHATLAARRDRIEAAGGYRPARDADDDLCLRLALDGARMRRLALPSVVRHPPVAHDGSGSGPADRWPASPDAATQAAFAELSTRLLGAPQQRIAALATAPLSNSAKLARFAEFEHRFAAAIAPLPLIERRALRRRLDRSAERLWQGLLRASRIDPWGPLPEPSTQAGSPAPSGTSIEPGPLPLGVPA